MVLKSTQLGELERWCEVIGKMVGKGRMVGTHGLSGCTQFVIQPRFFLDIDYIIRQYGQEVF